MANVASTRFVFDRKKTATREKKGLVQIEVLYRGRRKWMTTGIKVYSDQWTEKCHVVKCVEAVDYNRRLDSMKAKVDGYITDLVEQRREFDFDAFARWYNAEEEKKQTFIEWLENFVAARRDIAESTRTAHFKLVRVLERWNVIVRFDELTFANITRFDDYLKTLGLRQTTVGSYHKIMKTYVHEALRRGLLSADPYATMKVDRGKSEWGRFLSAAEVERIEKAELPTETLDKARDLFLMQCYTGLAYADLMECDFTKAELLDGMQVLTGVRHKTDVQYTIVLTPRAEAILRKYGGRLPKFSNQQYNMRLKVMADHCGIDRPIASHWGRRTCGMLLLNDGFPIEIVARVLGHADIRTTQTAYARILDRTVAKAFKEKE